jgi:DME family drug/metabolite transporter
VTLPERRRATVGSIWVASAAAGWGTWWLFLREAEREGPLPASLEALAPMLGLTLASFLLVGRDRVRVRARRTHWARILVLGGVDALNVVFFFAALQRTTVAIAVLTHYFTPVLVALGAPLAKLEPWHRRTFSAVFVSLVGLVLLLAPWSASTSASASASAERHTADMIGAGFGLLSAFCYATNVIVSKSLVPVFSGSEMAAYHGLLSVLFLAWLVPTAAWTHTGAHAFLWLSAGGLLPGATAGLLFAWGLRRVPASRASNLTLFEPLVATLSAAVLLHQEIGVRSLLGASLILGGAIVAVTHDTHPRPSSRETRSLRLY